MSTGSTTPYDFSYLDTLTEVEAGRGRVFLGQAARKISGRPTLLFVHGGYHGAWCFAHYLRHFDSRGIPSAAMDMRGHGGLPRDADFHLQGVRDMAEDVVAASAALPGPPVLVGHSAGALVAAVAGETAEPSGMVLLAPSPPGQLECLSPLPEQPEGHPLSPPDEATCREKFLAGETIADISPFTERLCPESPRLLNDRYTLRIHVDRPAYGMPALCLAAELDTGALHPPGQDLEVARFFGAEFHELAGMPHCMMVCADWRDSAGRIEAWYRRTQWDPNT